MEISSHDLIMIVKLSHDHYRLAVKFAMKLWYAGKPRGDWRSTGTKRDIGKYITDHALGKLGEIAFAKFLGKNWKIKAELDFDIYPGTLAIDRGDLVTIEIGGMRREPKTKVDIKSTKRTSKWAMIDLKEFDNRHYDAYIWFKVDLPLNHLARPIFDAIRNDNLAEIEKMIPTLNEIEAEPAGFAYRDEIQTSGIKFLKGNVVYNPDTGKREKLFIAKTNNIAVPISILKNDSNKWEELVQKIISG